MMPLVVIYHRVRGGHPEWHLQMDIFKAIKLQRWDLGIFFPPCTYLTVSANKWYKDQPKRKSGVLVGQERRDARKDAILFAKALWESDIPSIGMENPVGILSSVIGQPTQIIQPWMFGHGETKATCLWLKNLPKLKAINRVSGRDQKIFKMSPNIDRSKERSKTYHGIAKAMANQWSDYLLNQPKQTTIW